MCGMQNQFSSVALIGKYNTPEMREQVLTLANHLQSYGSQVWLEENTALHCHISEFATLAMQDIGAHVALVIVLGGDGTMLSAARALLDYDIPLVGINRGRIGFLTDVSADNMLPTVQQILSGAYQTEQRILLTASILRDGVVVGENCALNDVVITKTGKSRLIELEVHIDGQFVHRQRSDGLILATPTGTTAYSLSAGGPILHPTLDAIALVPICPHTLSNRPIAINSASKVDITLVYAEDAGVHFDGQLQTELLQGDKIVVERAQKKVSLLHPLGHSHYDMLRAKLNWG